MHLYQETDLDTMPTKVKKYYVDLLDALQKNHCLLQLIVQ